VVANELNVELLGQLPIVESIAEGSDNGNPIVLDYQHPVSKAFAEIAKKLIEKVKIRNVQLAPTPIVQINPNASCATD